MANLYKCCDCGSIIREDDIDTIQDYRGEYWGTPAYENVDVCPKCGSDCLEEYDNEDDYPEIYDPMTAEEDSISWQVAEEAYIARCMEMNCEE